MDQVAALRIRDYGEYALSWAREQGFAAMQFNAVVESNQAAVHLWLLLGFQMVGTVPEALEHPTLPGKSPYERGVAPWTFRSRWSAAAHENSG